MVPQVEFQAIDNAPIVTRPWQMVFLDFDPSARLQVAPYFIHELFPLTDVYGDSSRVDANVWSRSQAAVKLPTRKFYIGRHDAFV